MKFIKKLVLLISLGFLLVSFTSSFTPTFAESNYKVEFTNIDADSLSNSDKEQIVYGKPSGTISSNVLVKLVYEKKTCSIDNPSLPNTGTTTSLVTISAGFLTIAAAFSLLKAGKGKKLMTTLLIIGTGSLVLGTVDASQVTLNTTPKSITISKLDEISVDHVDCYEYVGYIIVKEDGTTTTESNVTTQEVTTTETTTETPTTKGPTTGETTTEETTEDTTTEQTESEEEVTIKPGIPSPA